MSSETSQAVNMCVHPCFFLIQSCIGNKCAMLKYKIFNKSIVCWNLTFMQRCLAWCCRCALFCRVHALTTTVKLCPICLLRSHALGSVAQWHILAQFPCFLLASLPFQTPFTATTNIMASHLSIRSHQPCHHCGKFNPPFREEDTCDCVPSGLEVDREFVSPI